MEALEVELADLFEDDLANAFSARLPFWSSQALLAGWARQPNIGGTFKRSSLALIGKIP